MQLNINYISIKLKKTIREEEYLEDILNRNSRKIKLLLICSLYTHTHDLKLHNSKNLPPITDQFISMLFFLNYFATFLIDFQELYNTSIKYLC